MMGFSVLFIFALLQICTLYDGGNSEDLSNITDSSNHLHHLHPRGLFSRAKAEKDEPLDLKTYLKFVASNYPPKDAVLVSDDFHYDYYILGSNKCKKMKLKIIKSLEISSKGANKALREFLVNKDNFEILEWKTWEDIESGEIPFRPVIVCKKFYIVEDDKGLISVTKKFFNRKNMQTLVLSLNNDIIEQHLEIDKYVVNEEEKLEREEVLKYFTAHNMNCKSAKHVVKLDHGNDRSRAFLKGRTHTVGGAIEASVVMGKFFPIVKAGGKISKKYDYSHLNSETTSKLNKALHSGSVEIEVPPNQSCVIEIKSRAYFARVPYSGRLTRLYNNGEERTTSINGIYDHQETSDLESFVYPCTPVPDATKCP